VELNIERLAMLATLAIMGAAIVAKMITLQLLRHMESTIAAVNQKRVEIHRELQRAVSKKNTNDRDVAKFEGKKKKIRRQIRKLRSELNEFQKKESDRQKQRAAVRGKLH